MNKKLELLNITSYACNICEVDKTKVSFNVGAIISNTSDKLTFKDVRLKATINLGEKNYSSTLNINYILPNSTSFTAGELEVKVDSKIDNIKTLNEGKLTLKIEEGSCVELSRNDYLSVLARHLLVLKKKLRKEKYEKYLELKVKNRYGILDNEDFYCGLLKDNSLVGVYKFNITSNELNENISLKVKLGFLEKDEYDYIFGGLTNLYTAKEFFAIKNMILKEKIVKDDLSLAPYRIERNISDSLVYQTINVLDLVEVKKYLYKNNEFEVINVYKNATQIRRQYLLSGNYSKLFNLKYDNLDKESHIKQINKNVRDCRKMVASLLDKENVTFEECLNYLYNICLDYVNEEEKEILDKTLKENFDCDFSIITDTFKKNLTLKVTTFPLDVDGFLKGIYLIFKLCGFNNDHNIDHLSYTLGMDLYDISMDDEFILDNIYPLTEDGKIDFEKLYILFPHRMIEDMDDFLYYYYDENKPYDLLLVTDINVICDLYEYAVNNVEKDYSLYSLLYFTIRNLKAYFDGRNKVVIGEDTIVNPIYKKYNEVDVIKILDDGASKKDERCIVEKANILIRTNRKEKLEEAYNYLKDFVEDDKPIILNLIGSLYANEKLSCYNPDKAFESYYKASLYNYGPALNNLSICYKKGIGVNVNNSLYVETLFRGVSEFNNNAICLVSDEYRSGKILPMSKKNSFYYSLVATLTGATICYQNNCAFYVKGMGVSKNLDAARFWAAKITNGNQALLDQYLEVIDAIEAGTL